MIEILLNNSSDVSIDINLRRQITIYMPYIVGLSLIVGNGLCSLDPIVPLKINRVITIALDVDRI